MTIPKKKSRSISLDGESFRWMVRATENELVLTVAHDDGGQLLQSTLNKLNLFREGAASGWEYVRQGRQITPSLVRQLMETALFQDWKPKEKISKPFILNALVWRDDTRLEPIQSISLDRWLDSPLRQRAATNGLMPVAQMAQEESEWMIQDLAWPCEFREAVLRLSPGESLPVPQEWISQTARDAGLTFSASFEGVQEDSGCPVLVIACEQYNALAGFQLMWW